MKHKCTHCTGAPNLCWQALACLVAAMHLSIWFLSHSLPYCCYDSTYHTNLEHFQFQALGLKSIE